jgi:phage N-6-adenine-methyltransferase
MAISQALYSSRTDEWPTPQSFFDALNAEFHFTLDACATRRNAKCTRYFTAAQDGLRQDWGAHRVFCNPPYGREWRHGHASALRPRVREPSSCCWPMPAPTPAGSMVGCTARPSFAS